MSDMMSSLGDNLIQNARAQSSQNALSKATGALSAAGLEKAKQAAQDFEAMFMSEMIKPMFESVEVDPVFGGGKGEEVFRGLLVQEYGKILARQGGVGLADQVRSDLIKIQEQSQNSVSNSNSDSTPTPTPVLEGATS